MCIYRRGMYVYLFIAIFYIIYIAFSYSLPLEVITRYWVEVPVPNSRFALLYSYTLRRVWLCVTPWIVAHQAPLSVGFSRQEHWSGLPCLPPGDLPHPEAEPRSPALAGGFLTIWATRAVHIGYMFNREHFVSANPSFIIYPWLSSPLVTISLFSMSVSLFLSVSEVTHPPRFHI